MSLDTRGPDPRPSKCLYHNIFEILAPRVQPLEESLSKKIIKT